MKKELKKKKLHILYIVITKNNLKISILDLNGKLIFKKSEGSLQNIRKGSINSPDTSLLMMNYLSSTLIKLKILNLGIYIKGSTRWKKLSLRRLISRLRGRVGVKFFKDISSVPHNGCSPYIKRRKRKRRKLKIRRFRRFKIIDTKWRYDRKSKKSFMQFKKPLVDVLSDKVSTINKKDNVRFINYCSYLKNKRYPKKLLLSKKKFNNSKKKRTTPVRSVFVLNNKNFSKKVIIKK